MSRLSRDDALMAVADVMASRGTCERAQVGAVIAVDGRIIATGFVGSPPGQPHCTDEGVGCERGVDGGCVRTVHAETNAIAFAAAAGVATRGATLYTTHAPCRACSKLIITAGITHMVYRHEYRDLSGLELLSSSRKVTIQHYTVTKEAHAVIPWY